MFTAEISAGLFVCWISDFHEVFPAFCAVFLDFLGKYFLLLVLYFRVLKYIVISSDLKKYMKSFHITFAK